ncbi:MAG: arylesterase [Azospira oryzae]|nr:MAG: arylesterase [Azospira oryzae]PZP79334.1 MAG: arylesterase [Azospira oryzae]
MLKKLVLVTWLLASASAFAAPVIVVLGDSLSSGYGLPTGSGWVTLLEARLRHHGYPHAVVNASVSGETSLGGRNRIAAVLERHHPDIVIVALGGNDGLRGLPPETTRANLAAIIEAAHRRNAQVVLVGMRLPPNYGKAYTEKFQAIFPELSRRYKVPLVPFLLEGFGERRDFFQPDGIHPTAAAQRLMLDNVWPALKPLLAANPSSSRAGGRAP